jgi:hypothetical protein
MNKVWKYILVGILLVCIVLSGFVLLRSQTMVTNIRMGQSSPTPRATDMIKPQPSFTPQVTIYPTNRPYPTPQILENGWHGFTYPEAGYSVEFPPDAVLSTSIDAYPDYNKTIISFPHSIDSVGASVLILTHMNIEKIILQEYANNELKQLYSSEELLAVTEKTFTTKIIANHSALIFESELNRPAIFIATKDRFYKILLARNMMEGNTPTKESVDLFWKIVGTFTIF